MKGDTIDNPEDVMRPEFIEDRPYLEREPEDPNWHNPYLENENEDHLLKQKEEWKKQYELERKEKEKKEEELNLKEYGVDRKKRPKNPNFY